MTEQENNEVTVFDVVANAAESIVENENELNVSCMKDIELALKVCKANCDSLSEEELLETVCSLMKTRHLAELECAKRIVTKAIRTVTTDGCVLATDTEHKRRVMDILKAISGKEKQ